MTIYQAFMFNRVLTPATFSPTPTNDHEHCVMCGTKFSAAGLQTGYSTPDAVHWVCRECFEEYKDAYHWTLEP